MYDNAMCSGPPAVYDTPVPECKDDGSGISYSYYPAINQTGKDTVATFGGALGGAAIGDLVSEFSDEFLVKLHLKKAL